MMEIESHVAPPSTPAKNKYPFDKMKVNDSLLFHSEKLAKNAYNSSSAYLRKSNLPWKFSCRKTKDGWRLWRIA